MMIRLFLSLALLAFLPSSAMAANDDIMMRDSVYYTWDDGVMSPEEMEMEANDVYRLCNSNVSQRNLFKCECLAGAFLLKREKLGPVASQHSILKELTLVKPPLECANTDAVAGDAYTMCMGSVAPLYPNATDNPEYCECVANKVAKEFARAPMMAPSYVRSLTHGSLVFCKTPQNRPKKAEAKTAN